MEDNSDLITHECDYCGEIIESLRDITGEEVVCPNCGENVLVPFEESLACSPKTVPIKVRV